MSTKKNLTPYAQKLLDPRWQRKRLEILNRDDFTCRKCGKSDSTLAVHHLYYVSKRDPWEYPDFALLTTCEECHKVEHCDSDFQEWEQYLNDILGGVLTNESITKLWNLSLATILDRQNENPHD
jgi:hypothetical protein